MELQKAIIGVKGQDDLVIWTNMDVQDISDACVCWLHRTKNRTSDSFVKYIMKKNHMSGHLAYTEEQYKKL